MRTGQRLVLGPGRHGHLHRAARRGSGARRDGRDGRADAAPALQKFKGSAPCGDASNVVDASSLTRAARGNAVEPCGLDDRKFASGRKHIIRKDRSFADALAHLDAREYDKAAPLLEVAYGTIGYPEAAVLLAKLSLNGLGVPRSTDKTLYWLDRAAGERFDARRDRLRFDPKDPEAANGMIEAALLLLPRLHLQGIAG